MPAIRKPSADRSRIMRSVRSKNTTPELMVRKFLFRNGLRFRLHRQSLPGKPDIVLPSRKVAIFVQGCFWHGHSCKRGARVPATNRGYWLSKISSNQRRDLDHRKALRALGWRVALIWECETRSERCLERLLAQVLAAH
ncbi:MAG TPA: very short patch repair endonuclease [Hyphomicrobium sp.]|nr:very short patch repair endonuclease [Hyphomicrobium sp.]